jgi:protein-disulfide isomerase
MKSPSTAGDNYVSATAAKQQEWLDNAKIATWQAKAGSAAAEANFNAAMQQVLQQKARQTGIAATPDSVYQSGIVASGSRYSQGAAAAKAKVVAALTKIMSDMSAVPLPARGPRGSSVNIMQRGTAIQTALAKNRGKYKVRGVAKATA